MGGWPPSASGRKVTPAKQLRPQTISNQTYTAVNFILRTLELLVFYPPEEGMYRILPIRVRTGASDTITFAPEPVPEGWTTAKLAWAASLWWSWRGIGWNYSPPLSPSQLESPYAPGSSRRDYLVRRGLYFLLVHVADDIASSFMRLGAPAYFLDGLVPYSSLSQFQRGLYSLATVERVWYSLELSHVLLSLVFVAAGGFFGLEGEIFSPWGWPPLFGSIANMWEYPGLAFMWSKVSRRCHKCVADDQGVEPVQPTHPAALRMGRDRRGAPRSATLWRRRQAPEAEGAKASSGEEQWHEQWQSRCQQQGQRESQWP